ncbi:STAS/SEC14 domain-containing protein [Segetibacter aerophilus]|uniref:STAS/SEC14 domain-containing protein n=1 Tax=Segetibacter aerophilus TaxID=670293 RepID=A0A512BFT2_9BACT|nr:STAS/SEC14 domain-containing protein [Segetibacter aerophilus]GEO10831.1 hypothetical protein SAE01_33270 [Segetibacter aerophilus]
MLQIMKDVPTGVVGVRALGKVTEEDYKTSIVPALEKASKEFGEINFLMVLETDLGNFTPGAWMQDAKASLKHFAKWNKIAIVSDQKIVEKLAHVFTYISPAEAKGFPVSDIELAKGWVAAPEEAKDLINQ